MEKLRDLELMLRWQDLTATFDYDGEKLHSVQKNNLLLDNYYHSRLSE